MSVLKKSLWGAGAALLALLLIVVVRAALAAESQVDQRKPRSLAVQIDDPLPAAERLAGALRIQTVSIENAPPRHAEFAKFQAYLRAQFPRVFTQLKQIPINQSSLILEWSGSNPQRQPILLMAHQDVVPVGLDTTWEHPAYSGRIAAGYIWGRGTLDMKGGLVAMLEAIDLLLADGFQPEATVFLALGHDEEINGLEGAKAIGEYFRSRQVRFDFIQDEGMIIADGLVPGVERPAALIGVAQKGEGSIELTASGESGHSSMPPPSTTVGVLSRAISRIEARPMPASIAGPTRMMFESLVGEMSFANRLVFANLWLFSPLINSIMADKRQTNASIRTTFAATMFRGSSKDNILPVRSTAVVNFRIHPRDSIESMLGHVKAAIDDERVQLRVLPGARNPSRVSPVDAPQYELMRAAIQDVFSGVAVAPALFVAISDSRHVQDLSENIYRFQPLMMTSEDLPRIHGPNERISLEAYQRYIEFYGQLLYTGAGAR